MPAVEFGHNQGVALAHGGEGLVEAGTGTSGAGEAVIVADAILGDATLREGLSLGCQVLPFSGNRAYPMRVAVMGEVYG